MTRDAWVEIFDSLGTFLDITKLYLTLSASRTLSLALYQCTVLLLQMQKKIQNVIDCLKSEPLSKRAIIPIPFNSEGSETVDWTNQGQNKCCRELHFYVEDNKLKCTGIVRMQNANIFVKNIHFFATLIDYVAKVGLEGKYPVGEYTHWITNLCYDRNATSC